MTPEQIQAIEERLKAATPGTWQWDGQDINIATPGHDAPNEEWDRYLRTTILHTGQAYGCHDGCEADHFEFANEADADLAAHAPEDIHALIEEVKRLQAILDAEIGKKGLDGWQFSNTSEEWIADKGRGPGVVKRVEAGKWQWSVWRTREEDGDPDKSWTTVPTALEGMEAAMATGKATVERIEK